MDRDSAKRVLLAIFDSAIQAVRPEVAVPASLSLKGRILTAGGENCDLSSVRRIWLTGAGKASAFMGREVAQMLQDRVTGGCLNVKCGHGCDVPKCEVNECGHPVPDENGLRGAESILELVSKADKDDLVICLISGGGSALLALPADGISLDDLRTTNALLLNCGATIHETNSVRKHLSRVKGGQLAKAAYPARTLGIIISDVIGDDLDVIASGPTVPDSSTYQDAMKVLRRHDLVGRMPAAVIDHLTKGINGEIPETLKPGDPVFQKVRNVVIANLNMALEAATEKASKSAFHAEVIHEALQGEAKAAGRWLAGRTREVLGLAAGAKRCLISGGETTVKVSGTGKGGRNMELALAAAMELAGFPGWAMLSCGTDGTDGPTDAAGAYCDYTTIPRARSLGLDPSEFLRNNDSYNFFRQLGDLVITGATGTNVMDIQVVITL